MTAASNFLENTILNLVLRNTAYTPATTVYVGLFTGSPASNLEAGILTNEVSGGSYARMAVTFTESTTGTTSNSANVIFPTATANWGTVTYVALLSAQTGGNVLFYGPLSISKNVLTNGTVRILANNLTVTAA